MKIGTLAKIIIGAFIISLSSIILLTVSFNNERVAKEEQAELKQLGLDLVAASDLLTEMAKGYV